MVTLRVKDVKLRIGNVCIEIVRDLDKHTFINTCTQAKFEWLKESDFITLSYYHLH